MMDISLLKELNELTREKNEFERALEESGYDLPPEEEDIGGEDDFDTGDDMGEGDYDYDDIGQNLDTQELQRIADWCEEECADMDDEELSDEIGDQLEQLDYQPEEIAAGISQVMSMLGREAPPDDEMGGEEEFGDEEPMDDMGDEEQF